MKKYKPVARQSINVSSRRVNHLVVTRQKRDLPKLAADLAHPKKDEIFRVEVKDDENNEFEATLIPQGTNKRRLALRLVSPDLAALRAAAAADAPLEALISITLIIAEVVNATTGEVEDWSEMTVTDVPVDYVVDDGAPAAPLPGP